MIELSPSDFLPFDDFIYFQHQMDTKYHALPKAELDLIQPIRREKAQEIWEYAYEYLAELSQYLFADTSELLTSSSLYEWIRHIDMNNVGWSVGRDIGQQSLLTLNSQDDQVVIVLWAPEEAVAVPWHIFYTYWDDFCRIGLEDVGVLSVSEEWYLLYYHEDQMVFGRPRLPLLDKVARKSLVEQTKPLIHQEEVLRLLLANEKLAAIKLYHQETGVGYKKAMEAVNKLLAELNHDSK
jgi:hypothetical protein